LSRGRKGLLALLAFGALLSAGVAAFVISQGSGFVRTGEPAPSFELATLGGGSVSLADLRGKVVYVNFWATWCAPCVDEAPSLQRLYDALAPEGFEILALSIDDPKTMEAVRAFRERFELEFPILLDPDKNVYSQYGATGVPETYLIDAEGRLAEAYIGPRDWSDPRYARAVRRLLDRAEAGNHRSG